MVERSPSVFAVGRGIVPVAQRLLWAGVAALLLLIGGVRLLLGTAADRRNLWLLVLLPGGAGAGHLVQRAEPIFNDAISSPAPPFYLLVAAATDVASRRPELLVKGVSPGCAGDPRRRHALLAQPLFHQPGVQQEPRLAIWPPRWRLGTGVPDEQVRVAQNFPNPALAVLLPRPIEHVVLPPAATIAPGRRAVTQLPAPACAA